VRNAALTLILGLATLAVTAEADAPRKAAPPPARKGPVAHAAKPVGPAYGKYVTSWHTPAQGKSAPLDGAGRPMLALVSINTGDRVELRASTDRGGFRAEEMDHAAFVLREAHSGNEHPIEPRLLDVVYRIQRHFDAQEVRVISGYRTPRGRSGSNHGKGRAMDVVVPGASDEDVAKFARELGYVGVGVYPHSGFVHVDVRERSYFWVDASLPGKRNRERGILADLAKKSDAQAVARGERATPPFLVLSDVDLALAAARAAAPEPPDEDDDVD
jgi:uncharacterized protein YcbK (DUF882 family)